MTTTTSTSVAAARPPQRTLAGMPLLLPKRRDPRLKVAAIVVTIQVLGQTVLGFKLSIAQILVTLLVSAIVEIALTIHSSRVIAWPASALLTGNGVALLLRASGTRHGDWWTLHGIHWFLIAAVGGLLTKHFYRPGGQHLFNPANVGIVAVLAVVGSPRVFPQYLWWGDFTWPSVIASLAVIAFGAVWALRPLGLVPALGSFLVCFGAGLAVLAARGSCMVAVWQTGPVCGSSFWVNIAFSPEVLVFACYMLTDPKTVPAGSRGRLLFGAGTAALALVMVATQSTEYGIKLSILSSLVIACAARPLVGAVRRLGGTRPRPQLMDFAVMAAILAIVTMGLVTVAHDPALSDLERGIRPVGSTGQ